MQNGVTDTHTDRLTQPFIVKDKKCYPCPRHAPVSAPAHHWLSLTLSPQSSASLPRSASSDHRPSTLFSPASPHVYTRLLQTAPKHSPGQNCHAPGLWAVQEAAVEDAGPALRHSTRISPDLGFVCWDNRKSSYGNGESGHPTRQTQHWLKWISTSEQFY